MHWHKSTGIIKYDPHRFGMKTKTQWWAVVNVDKEITKYYRWWVKNHYWVDLNNPSWDAHISVIRGEKPPEHLISLWKKYDGKRIEFEYQHFPRIGTPPFWHIDVKCPFLTNLREEFGFPSDWIFHITIGKNRY